MDQETSYVPDVVGDTERLDAQPAPVFELNDSHTSNFFKRIGELGPTESLSSLAYDNPDVIHNLQAAGYPIAQTERGWGLVITPEFAEQKLTIEPRLMDSMRKMFSPQEAKKHEKEAFALLEMMAQEMGNYADAGTDLALTDMLLNKLNNVAKLDDASRQRVLARRSKLDRIQQHMMNMQPFIEMMVDALVKFQVRKEYQGPTEAELIASKINEPPEVERTDEERSLEAELFRKYSKFYRAEGVAMHVLRAQREWPDQIVQLDAAKQKLDSLLVSH